MKLLACVLGAAVATAGCIDSLMGDDGDDAPTEGGPYKVFLAARGTPTGDVSAGLAFLRVVTGDGPVTLTLHEETVDLGGLADDGTALLVASGPASGRIERHEVGFTDVLRDGTVLSAAATWTVPFVFNVTGEVEVTLTLDLGASVANATFTPEPDSLVAENANGKIAEASKSQLSGRTPPREDIEPIGTPEAAVEGRGGAFPSWPTGTLLNFTVTVPGTPEERISNAIWTFSPQHILPGFTASHTFREPGPHTVRVDVYGTQGQRSSTNVTVEAWFTAEGGGEGLVGLGGQEVQEGRTHQDRPVDVPGETITRVKVVLNYTGALESAGAGESEVRVRLTDPDGNVVAESEDDTAKPQILEATGPFTGGTYTVRVIAVSGTSIGYTFTFEAHYL